MRGFEFHPEARLDLDDLWEYIGADNLDAADRVVAEILSSISAVVPFPGQGHRRPDLTSRPLRFLLVREYLVAYAPEETPLWVCRGDARTPQPARNGRNPQRQGMTAISSAAFLSPQMSRFVDRWKGRALFARAFGVLDCVESRRNDQQEGNHRKSGSGRSAL